MTILVAVHTKNEIGLAWDSQVTTGDRCDYGTSIKAVKVAGSTWIAAAGSLGTWDVVRTNVLSTITSDIKTHSDAITLAQRCANDLADNFKPQYPPEGDDTHSLIVVSPYGVWKISTDHAVQSFGVGRFCAVGAGAQFSYGAMHVLNVSEPYMSAVDKAVIAVETACKYSIFCGGPIKKVTVHKCQHK